GEVVKRHGATTPRRGERGCWEGDVRPWGARFRLGLVCPWRCVPGAEWVRVVCGHGGPRLLLWVAVGGDGAVQVIEGDGDVGIVAALEAFVECARFGLEGDVHDAVALAQHGAELADGAFAGGHGLDFDVGAEREEAWR